MTKKTKRNSKLFESLQVIPDGSFVVFNTKRPVSLVEHLDQYNEILKKRGITGIILDSQSSICDLTDEELSACGLYRLAVNGPGTDQLH